MSRNFLGISSYTWYRMFRDRELDNRRAMEKQFKVRGDAQIAITFSQDMFRALELVNGLALDKDNAFDQYAKIIQAMSIVENSKPLTGYTFIKTNFVRYLNMLASACKLVASGDMEKAKFQSMEAATRIGEIFASQGALVEMNNRVNAELQNVPKTNTQMNNASREKVKAARAAWRKQRETKRQERLAILRNKVLSLAGIKALFVTIGFLVFNWLSCVVGLLLGIFFPWLLYIFVPAAFIRFFMWAIRELKFSLKGFKKD